ncbi:MAG TPA: hypothetical protein VFC29_01265 [Candidatus Limnocylindrales bacterium]|nr:hypothetical protein [Candidatus Limnocylindrales bacterium]
MARMRRAGQPGGNASWSRTSWTGNARTAKGKSADEPVPGSGTAKADS